MKGSVYLIGGGDIRNGDTAVIDSELKELAPTGSTFVFFPTAAEDSFGYIETIRATFKDQYTIIAPTQQDGREFALEAINNASVIYLGGGETDLLLDLFREWELVHALRAAWERGAHLVGMSAGAQALCDWYVHEEEPPTQLRRGWNFIPYCVLVHATPNSTIVAQCMWAQHREAHTSSFVAVEEGFALRINNSGIQKI